MNGLKNTTGALGWKMPKNLSNLFYATLFSLGSVLNTNAQEVKHLTDTTSFIPISIVNKYDLSDSVDRDRLPKSIIKHIKTYDYKHATSNHDIDGLPRVFYHADAIEAIQLDNIHVGQHLKDVGTTWFIVRFLDKETGEVKQEELIPKTMFDSIVEGVKKLSN